MATQSPPQPAVSQSTAVASQARPPTAPGPAHGGPAVRTGEAGSGATNLVASGGLRVAEGGAGNTVAGQEYEFLRFSEPLERLPVGLVVSVPVREFRIRHLLAMEPGALIETQWGHGEDLPLTSGDVQLAWSEFEVVDTRLAMRVTRLA